VRSGFTAPCVALLVAGALLIPAFPASADSAPTIVAGTSANSERKTAVAPNGTIYAAYTEPFGNTTAVIVERSADGGSTWTALPRIGAAEAFRSCVAVDSQGVLHIAWTEFVGPNRQVFYGRWESGPNWTGAQRISDTPGYSGFPSLALDSADRVHLAWYGFDGSTYQVYYRYLDASGWHATVQATHGVQDANNPSLAVGSDGKVHIAFFTYFRGATDVWYLQGGPTGWNIVEHVNPDGVPSARPSIAVLSNGTPVIAYSSGANATLEVRLAMREPGGGWSSNVALSGLGEGGDNPSVVADDYAANFAVFYENSVGAIRYRTFRDGAWLPAQSVPSSGDSHWVSASWAPFGRGAVGGNATVLWTESAPVGYRVNFTSVPLFGPPACKCPSGTPWWQGLTLPLALIALSGISMAALWVASLRTKGGGRG
jgi:hypothetical protein